MEQGGGTYRVLDVVACAGASLEILDKLLEVLGKRLHRPVGSCVVLLRGKRPARPSAKSSNAAGAGRT